MTLDLEKLAEEFKGSTRNLLSKREGDAHFSSSRLMAEYAAAKQACLDAGMPVSVLDELRSDVIAERGGVDR